MGQRAVAGHSPRGASCGSVGGTWLMAREWVESNPVATRVRAAIQLEKVLLGFMFVPCSSVVTL